MFKKTKKQLFSIIGLFLATGFVSGCNSNPKEPDPEPTKLEIVSQPKTVTIDNGDPMAMTVEVNNPKLVKSYQWYNALWYEKDQEFIKSHPLLGTKAKTNSYNLPSYYEEPSAIQGFKCVITDLEGKSYETEWATVHVNPGKEFSNQYMLGDYPLPLGKTFDLSTTPYGTGTITINEKGDYFTFDNVMYTNEFMDSNFDGFGFRVVTYGEECEGFTFEFNGFNCFHNVYWNDDWYDGGAVFQVQAMELGDDTRPALFKGNGSVTFYGGSYAIYGNYVDLIQDIDMSFYSQPGRASKGLFANTYTLKKGHSLNANVSSYAIMVEDGATFEENSIFVATLTSAPVDPDSLNHLNGVYTNGDVNIKSADVRINVLLNAKQENDEMYSVAVNGFETNQGDVKIENSNVYFSVMEYNNDFEHSGFVEPSSVATSFISAVNIDVINSNTFIDIKGKFISEARGFNCHGCFNASESYIYIEISANTAGGICCYHIDPPEGADLSFSITCFNTDMDINLSSNELSREKVYPHHDGGLYACNFTFSSTKESVISINVNGDIPTISHKFAVTNEDIFPHEGYTGEHIKYENATITSTSPFVHNEQTYDSASFWHVIFESLYEDLGSGNYQFINNLVITY